MRGLGILTLLFATHVRSHPQCFYSGRLVLSNAFCSLIFNASCSPLFPSLRLALQRNHFLLRWLFSSPQVYNMRCVLLMQRLACLGTIFNFPRNSLRCSSATHVRSPFSHPTPLTCSSVPDQDQAFSFCPSDMNTDGSCCTEVEESLVAQRLHAYLFLSPTCTSLYQQVRACLVSCRCMFWDGRNNRERPLRYCSGRLWSLRASSPFSSPRFAAAATPVMRG